MENQYEKLKKILRQMFQMDQADLDFGIYRIMNQKRDEIENFLDKELLPQVKIEFLKYKDLEVEEKRKELEMLERTVRDSGLDPDEAPKVLKIREELGKYGDEEALAAEVFSHLSTFFRRYYDNGDFLSLRRYKKDTYAIPYEGEEVKLHWANADQYYIKSSEYLRDYAFKISDNKKVHFKLIEATQEKDNIKELEGKERKFILCEEEPLKIEGNNLFIQFVYLANKEKQDKINTQILDFLVSKSGKLNNFHEIFKKMPTAKNKNRTLIEKHLNNYTSRFNFDFFIHKNLEGFLKRELDFYIKNEVLFVDDLDAQDIQKIKTAVAKMKVIKTIAHKVIDMLAHLEEFQKKMWLKKKFVTDCGYCVTLDRIPEELYEEIIRNDRQREEWVKLFSINEIKGDLINPAYSEPLSIKFLKANLYLILDTKHFPRSFKEKLLQSFDDIDDACDGIIINSENFQALNLLQEKYKKKVKCVYIDPPYNTSEETFIYKNLYKHSSWISMIANRVEKSFPFLSNDGALEIAIDDEELYRLKMMIDSVFGSEKYIGTLVVQSNPRGRGINSFFATSHDYCLCYSRNPSDTVIVDQPLTDEQAGSYRYKDTESTYRLLPFRRSGGLSTPDERPNSEFPIFYSIEQNKIVGVGGPRKYEYPHKYVPKYILILNSDGSTEEKEANHFESFKDVKSIMPLDSSGRWRVWRWSDRKKILETAYKDDFVIQKNEEGFIIQLKDRIKAGRKPKTIWVDSKYDASSHGTNLLQDILGDRRLFGYPKSLYATYDAVHCILGDTNNEICLDYFAGSGTTGHAVINLNREDGGKRKYILVEMGQYFDTVLKPRIQKVIYSKNWKAGKPVSREGSSHMFKYMKLESYEDTLDNLIVKRTTEQNQTLEMYPKVKEGYILHYWLDVETRNSDSLLNIDRFEDPFNYMMKIRQDDELKEQKIDLIETFNSLIGLYVQQTEIIRGFKVFRGKLRTGEKTLVIWRNVKEKSNDDLNEFFVKQKYNTQDFEFDRVYVNGDNNLENLKLDEDVWKVILIEDEFKKRMFDVQEM